MKKTLVSAFLALLLLFSLTFCACEVTVTGAEDFPEEALWNWSFGYETIMDENDEEKMTGVQFSLWAEGSPDYTYENASVLFEYPYTLIGSDGKRTETKVTFEFALDENGKLITDGYSVGTDLDGNPVIVIPVSVDDGYVNIEPGESSVKGAGKAIAKN